MIRTLLLMGSLIAGATAQAQVTAPLGPGSIAPVGPSAISGGNPGPPPTGCTNQFVFDYSNSCALIAQAWGQ